MKIHFLILFLKRGSDIHRLSNIRILTYGISGATGAERRSRACVTGGISLSPLRGQLLSLSSFRTKAISYNDYPMIIDMFSLSYEKGGGHFIAGWVGGQ